MPTRRLPDDDSDGPRPRKKRKRKKDDRRPVRLAVFLGVAALIFLAIGAAVFLRWNARRDRDPAGGPGGSAGGPVSAPGVELVTNGGFEDGPDPDPGGPGFTPVEAGSAAVRGWAVTRGSVDYIGPYWQHADGRRSLDLSGNEPGAVAQTLRTRPGRRYRVTFRLAGNACGGGTGVKAVVVSAAGARAEFTFDTAGRAYEDMGWVTKTWEFTAAAAETTLEFASATPDAPACGPALDGVSVKEIGP